MAKIHVKSGDQVAIISGEDRGKKGKVLEVHPKTGRVIVDGINIQKKHTRATQTNPQVVLLRNLVPSMHPMLQLFAQVAKIL